MAMKKISDLTEATTVTLTDLVEIEAAAGSRKAKKVNVLALITESVSANHVIDDREDSQVVLMTTGAGDKTVDLPDSSTDDVRAGDLFRVLKVDAGAGKITIDRQGTDTIDAQTGGVPLYSIGNYVQLIYLGSGAYTVLQLKSDGTGSNGSFELQADGSQKCQDVRGSGSGAPAAWTFPMAFSTATGVIFTGTAYNPNCNVVITTGAPSTSSVTWGVIDETRSYQAGVITCALVALGRWRT